MLNSRTYGSSPYQTAVIHGGPGALGSVAPVARALAEHRGVLEPLQTATTVNGQAEELAAVLRDHADGPAALIGHSWGAWLAWIVTAWNPDLVSKLILVGSGPFEAHYAEQIMPTRLSRMTDAERADLADAVAVLDDPSAPDRDAKLSRIGALMGKVDTYEPLPLEPEVDPIPGDASAFTTVWPEAAAMRASGELLRLVEKIDCPVVAIHGDHDPHPYEGVRNPLARELKDFKFVLLERCGHEPWREKYAREAFYRVLNERLT